MTAAPLAAPAATPIDLGLYPELQRFGAKDISACFSCGNCTATCPMAADDNVFPRKMIRYAQVGMRDALVSSKEIWSCYHCGECSDSCPTNADPGEFMAAARRFAIASYDPTGIAKALYGRPVVALAVAALLAFFFAAFMYSAHGPMDGSTLAIFEWIPSHLIHDLGIIVMILVVLAGLAGVVRMARAIGRREKVGIRDVLGSGVRGRAAGALWDALGRESLGQAAFRADCSEEETAALPLVRRRWFLHAMTLWGFLGLLAATGLDYGFALLGWKETGTPVPLWYPIRLLGTVAGAALVYGVTMLAIDRFRRTNRSAAKSTTADWLLLGLLWLVGVTGFALELALYLPSAPAWGYWVFLVHVAFALELVLLAPFMKLAHAAYRPVALFFVALAERRSASSD